MVRKVQSIDEIDKYIGFRIQELRLMLGLSRQQLAEKVLVTHQQLQKYENGTNRVTAGRLAIFSKSLNRPISYFYEGVQESEIDDTKNISDHITKFDNQRKCIEVSRNFMKIKKQEHREAIDFFIKTMAIEDVGDSL